MITVLRKPIAPLLLILVVGFCVYSNTFYVPFFFDDEPNIVKHPLIRDFRYFVDTPPLEGGAIKDFFRTRYVGYFSFAINYALNGLDVTGYHVFNLLIHLANALLVYWLLILTFRTPFFAGHEGGDAGGVLGPPRVVALFAALLFVSHPVQTQAVTYVVQRFASLATLFYLLSLVMYIKWRLVSQAAGYRDREGEQGRTGRSSSRVQRYALYAVSLVSAVLGMKTKEVVFTLPIMTALYEFFFFRGKVKKRLLFVAPLSLTMLIVPLTLLGQKGALASARYVDESLKIGASQEISRWDYLLTQFRVVITYLRLLVFPVRQNFDYDYPVYHSFLVPAVFFSFLCVFLVLVLGIYLLLRSSRTEGSDRYWFRLAAFGIFWFFVTLSVESSVIPLADVIFEHRVYLPSVGFFVALLSAVEIAMNRLERRGFFVRKAAAAGLVLIVAALSVAAFARNAVWGNKVVFWADTAEKSPLKARPHLALGTALDEQGKLSEAFKEYEIALKLDPRDSEPYKGMGNIYFKLGRFDEAIKGYRAALAIDPADRKAHNNLGYLYSLQGRIDEAVREYETALRADPGFVDARINLGIAYRLQGRLDDAIREYQTALLIDPSVADAHNNLGNVYFQQGHVDDAIREYQAALRLDPSHGDARRNLEILRGLTADRPGR